MKKRKHLLSDLWESFPEAIASQHSATRAPSIKDVLADFFAIGVYYSYVINLYDNTLLKVAPTVLPIHGLVDYPVFLDEIIALIHPEDFDYVLAAEKVTLEKMREIGFQHQLRLKTSYCFRMKVADGSYHLFHHQAIHLAKDKEGRLLTALNIHTDIQHLTTHNSYIVLITGIGDRKDYVQVDLSKTQQKVGIPKLTRREMEIVNLLSIGLTSKQIAQSLFISEETVRVHRKNIFKKTNTTKVSQLVRQCLENGLL